MLTHHVVALLVTALTHFVLAIVVYTKGRQRLTNVTYALYSLAISWWSGLEALAITRGDTDSALFWWRVNHVGVVLIPVFFVHFVISLLEPHQQQSKVVFIRAIYGFGFLFLALNATPILIHEVVPKFYFRYFINPGAVYILFFGLWVTLAIYGLIMLFKVYVMSSGAKRNQLNYFCWSMFIAYLGGIPNFFPTFNVMIPYLIPFGTYAIPLYALATTYAIIRYRLLDVTIALTRTTVLIGVYGVVIGLPLLLGFFLKPILTGFLGNQWWLVPLGVYTVAALLGPFIYLYFQRRAEGRLLREQRSYQTTLVNAARGMVQVRDLKQLLNLIIHLLTRAMKLTRAGIFLLDEKTGNYVLQASRDRDVLKVGLTLDQGDALITWLTEHQESLVYEEIKQWSASQSNGTVSPTTLDASLRRIEASVVVPSFANKTLLGLLVLGEKSTRQMYSQDDLNVLQTLANQAALAIQNAQFYEELQNTTAQLIHNSKLTAMGKMASGMSHQIHNRLYVLTVEAGALREDLLQRLRVPALPESERQALLDKLDASLRSIEEESVKGSTIVKTLLQFSKPTTDMKLASMQELVQGGLTMVSLKRDLKQLSLRLELPDELPRIKVNVPQMQDAFFNLVDNAYDAIDQKAERIRLGLFHAPGSSQGYQGEITIRAEMSEDQRKVLVTVSDNGMGMMAEEQDRLFLPFYTTKATAEKGSGLGLFVIREILKAHRGAIRLQRSEYGKGTAFLVELPLPEPAPSA